MDGINCDHEAFMNSTRLALKASPTPKPSPVSPDTATPSTSTSHSMRL